MDSKSNLYFYVVLAIFFLSGLTSVLNTVVVAHLRSVLTLDHLSISMLFLSYYMGYLICSPLVARLFSGENTRRGILFGVFLGALGSVQMMAAGYFSLYACVLSGVFALGGGTAATQVLLNPVVLALGEPQRAAMRLSFAQSFTSVGMVVAPTWGAYWILGAEVGGMAALCHAYLFLASMWIGLVGCVGFVARTGLQPKGESVGEMRDERGLSPFRDAIVWMGGVAVALAIGIEIGVGNYLIPFLSSDGFSLEQAGIFVTLYWISFAVGRGVGAVLSTKFPPEQILIAQGGCGALLALYGSLVEGEGAVGAVMALGLCASALFPMLYTLVLESCRCSRVGASSFLCMANLGGALVPIMQGAAADLVGVQASFIIPACCFVLILAAVGGICAIRAMVVLQRQEVEG